ncbi:hypothetical protein OHR68_00025 [Spirillospora sp. NBC_00431]
MKDTFGMADIHLGEGSRFACHTYPGHPDAGPILTISAAGLTFGLSNRSRGAVEAGDVANARRLLEVVTRFTAEVERLHALNTLNATNADPVQDGAA